MKRTVARLVMGGVGNRELLLGGRNKGTLGPARSVAVRERSCLQPGMAETAFPSRCLHRAGAKLEGNETLKVVELDRRVNATF